KPVAEEFLQRLSGNLAARTRSEISGARGPSDPRRPVRRVRFATRLIAGEDQLAGARIMWTAVNFSRGPYLCRAQAGAGILASRALHDPRIKVAVPRIVQERVGRDAA